MQKILVMASHPDDEVLGCGGTIKMYTQGGVEVYLCIVTKAYPPEWSPEFIENRPQEVDKVAEVLGIKKVFFLDFPTVKLDSVLQKDLNFSISKVVREVEPETIFIPHFGDLNQDHRLVHEASLVASRPFTASCVKRILAYETLSETEWGVSHRDFRPTVYQNIESTLKYKIEAMSAYASELQEPPHPRSLEIIEALAKKRGSEAGLRLAEAFMLIREISR